MDSFALSVEAQYGNYQWSRVEEEPFHISMPVALNSVLSRVEINKDCSFVATFRVILEYHSRMLISMIDPAYRSSFERSQELWFQIKNTTPYDYELVSVELDIGDPLASMSIPNKSHWSKVWRSCFILSSYGMWRTSGITKSWSLTWLKEKMTFPMISSTEKENYLRRWR